MVSQEAALGEDTVMGQPGWEKRRALAAAHH